MSAENGPPRQWRFRPIHRVRFWLKTRHWDRSHFPGCPVRYGTGTECFDPGGLLCSPRPLPSARGDL